MYELNKIIGNTYVITSPTNIGLYVDGNDAYLIDSGNDDDAAKKVLRILNEHHWQLKLIINTHYHADHTGGNNYLCKHTDCSVYTHYLEAPFLINNELEVISMWGGVPIKEYVNKSVMAKPTPKERLTDTLPSFFEVLDLPGHSPNMIAIKTPDDVLFIGDALLSTKVIAKYNVCYLYDVENYLTSLQTLSTYIAKCYVPSHATVKQDLNELLTANLSKVMEIAKILTEAIKVPKTIEDLVAHLATQYQIPMSSSQYVLISTTIKGYLKYLIAKNIAKIVYKDNKQYIMINE